MVFEGEKKPNHICHHRCGQHTILVGSRGSVSLMRLIVRNSPSQHEEVAENPQSRRKNMAVSIIVIIYVFVVTFTHNAFLFVCFNHTAAYVTASSIRQKKLQHAQRHSHIEK